MNQKTVQKIFASFYKANPHPKTELVYRTPFELLVAVILSAQATDKSVNKATKQLFQMASTPEKMLKLGEEKLRKQIKTIGLYRTKAKNIIKTSHVLIEKYQAQVPDQREDLESLAGVGRKTANVILNTVFHQPTIAVDTHIFRVANRVGLAKGKSPLIVERKLLKVIPPTYLHDAHHWLVLHGRYVCTARKPHCPDCLIRTWCTYRFKTV